MPKGKYYIFTDDGDVVRTDDREVADAFDEAGVNVVIDGEKGEFLSGAEIPDAPMPEGLDLSEDSED